MNIASQTLLCTLEYCARSVQIEKYHSQATRAVAAFACRMQDACAVIQVPPLLPLPPPLLPLRLSHHNCSRPLPLLACVYRIGCIMLKRRPGCMLRGARTPRGEHTHMHGPVVCCRLFNHGRRPRRRLCHPPC
jgi:hypothetical protein